MFSNSTSENALWDLLKQESSQKSVQEAIQYIGEIQGQDRLRQEALSQKPPETDELANPEQRGHDKSPSENLPRNIKVLEKTTEDVKRVLGKNTFNMAKAVRRILDEIITTGLVR